MEKFEEMKQWRVAALQQFLRARGWATTGSKEILVARAFSAWENDIPVQPTASELDALAKGQYDGILGGLPDPLLFDGSIWLSEEDGIELWPNIMYHDICDYIMRDHPGTVSFTRNG